MVRNGRLKRYPAGGSTNPVPRREQTKNGLDLLINEGIMGFFGAKEQSLKMIGTAIDKKHPPFPGLAVFFLCP